MAHLSPPPSPPTSAITSKQQTALEHQLNLENASANHNFIQRASAFSSVLNQKWNPRGKILFTERKRD